MFPLDTHWELIIEPWKRSKIWGKRPPLPEGWLRTWRYQYDNGLATHRGSWFAWHKACFQVRGPDMACRHAGEPGQCRCEIWSRVLRRSLLNTSSSHSILTSGRQLSTPFTISHHSFTIIHA